MNSPGKIKSVIARRRNHQISKRMVIDGSGPAAAAAAKTVSGG